MRSAIQKYLIACFFLTALLPLSPVAQDLTGIWRGYFQTYSGDEYRFELQIEHKGSNRISGVSYSYLDTRFYGKATLTGNFNESAQSAIVQEIKTVEVKMSGGSIACIMKCLLSYSTSGKEQFLEGSYSSMYEKTDSLYGIIRGGNCGGGIVRLRKVATSDFYVEPFLRDNDEREKPKPPVEKKEDKPKPKPVTKPPVKKPVEVKKDTVQKTKKEPVVINKPPRQQIKIPVTTRSRENELVKTLIVTSREISVRLYDNGEIDNDTISVYLDGKAIISKQRLTTSPITVKLEMDNNNSEHTLVMVAENLGRIPPNTSLMIVQDGEKRIQVSITSTEQKNAMVRFRYEGDD